MLCLTSMGFPTSRMLEGTSPWILFFLSFFLNQICLFNWNLSLYYMRETPMIMLEMVAIVKNSVQLSWNWFLLLLLDNGFYTLDFMHFSLSLQDGSSPELPSLERKNKRRKIKGKKGMVQNILGERSWCFLFRFLGFFGNLPTLGLKQSSSLSLPSR